MPYVADRRTIGLLRRVPLYAIASLIALFSLDAAFFIDTVRDLYEVSTSIQTLYQTALNRSLRLSRPL